MRCLIFFLKTLLQFFHARGEGLSLEDMKSGDYKVGGSSDLHPPLDSVFLPLTVSVLPQVLDEELRLNKCSSFELIEQYYLEKISQQVCFNSTRPTISFRPNVSRRVLIVQRNAPSSAALLSD